MARKNSIAKRKDSHAALLARELVIQAKKEKKSAKFKTREPKKRKMPKNLVRGSSLPSNKGQYEAAKATMRERRAQARDHTKKARTAPKAQAAAVDGTVQRRAENRARTKSARSAQVDARRGLKMDVDDDGDDDVGPDTMGDDDNDDDVL